MSSLGANITSVPFPLKPPRSWFDIPEANEATPLTYERSGKVYGHLALWGTCHTGFLNGAMSECVQPPPSRSEYQHFHLGTIETQEGEDVRVGKVTYATNHAPLSASAKAAAAHYDHTGSVGAFVRARNGNVGIWVSGAVRSDITPEGFRDLRANPPSGDWRSLNSALELVASLAVPVPGFPIPRAELSLAASANGEPEVATLILPAWQEEEEFALVASAEYQAQKREIARSLMEPRSREYRRRLSSISNSLT